jgi:phosphatidylserine/phosphatidylglycerophosphate/cardiolipin synthase-like enzyme
VKIRLLHQPYVHAKVILVDGRRGYLGSENFSMQSLDHNREIGVLLRGSAVTEIRRVFRRDWRRGLPARPTGS